MTTFVEDVNMADSLRALVVDDDQVIGSLVEDALSDGGFQSSIASSGEAALILLGKGKYDLLVLDIKLGKDGFAGWHVARRARAIDPGVPVIYVTGSAAAEWAVHGVEKSIMLTKPFRPADLLTAIRSF